MSTQTEGQATPRPWYIAKHAVPDGIYQVGIYGEGCGRDLATIKSCAADSDLIVTAVNQHDARVRVCEAAIHYIKEFDATRSMGRDQWLKTHENALRAALAALSTTEKG